MLANAFKVGSGVLLGENACFDWMGHNYVNIGWTPMYYIPLESLENFLHDDNSFDDVWKLRKKIGMVLCQLFFS